MSPIAALIWCCLLTLVQALLPVLGAMQQVGLAALAGNREDLPALEGWAGRAQRAHRNMLESMVIFAALVLAAVALGKVGKPNVILGAQLFFWARLVYAGVYTIGIPWLRTAVWLVSVIGLAMIFLALI